MDHIFFDQSFISSNHNNNNNANSSNNNTQQLHSAILSNNNNNNNDSQTSQVRNSTSSLQQRQITAVVPSDSFQDSIPLELRLQGLPNRPVGSAPMKVADRLPLEMSGGTPCFREDLEQLIRTKLISELFCPPTVSFDICQSDEWLVDEKLFDKVRDEYTNGRRKGVWSLNVTILSLGEGGNQTNQQQRQSNNNNLIMMNVSSSSSSPKTTTNASSSSSSSSLTAAALRQHLQGGSTLHNQPPLPTITETPTTINNNNNMQNQIQQNQQQNQITRSYSIGMLRNINLHNLSSVARGSWTIVATVVDIRQKSDSITELHLAQPELDPRERISAVTFKPETSKLLREKVFQHCEVQIELASLVAKTENDRKYQRDTHPYKIVMDGNTRVTVIRSAQDNVAAAAILRAATVVVVAVNSNNNVSSNNFNLLSSTNNNNNNIVNRHNNGGIITGFNSGNNNNTIIHSFSSNSSTTANIAPVTQQNHSINFMMPTQSYNNISTVGIIANKIPLPQNNFNTMMMMPSSSSSSSSSGNSGSSPMLMMMNMMKSTAPPASTNAPKRTLFLQPKQQQQQNEQQQQFEQNRVLCGAPNPSRQDIEARDGIVAIETANQTLEELVNAGETRTKIPSTSTSTNVGSSNSNNIYTNDNCVQTCFFCGVDSDSQESTEKFKKRLEKVFKKTCCVGKAGQKSSSSLTSFLPSKLEEYQLLFGDPRISLKRNIHQDQGGKTVAAKGRLWCRTRVTDPMTKKNHRVHPRCAHICWEYQQNRSMKLAECSPNVGEECRICELCGEAGAVTKCYDPTCDRWFHSSCAIFAKGYIDFGQYDPFRPCASCPQHAYLSFKKKTNTTTTATAVMKGKENQKNKNKNDDDDDDDEELLLLGATTKNKKNNEDVNESRRRQRDGKKSTNEDEEDADEDDELSFLDPAAFDARKVEAGDLRDPDDE